MKKTIKVKELVNMVNEMNCQDISQDAKRSLNVLIEEVMFRCENYNGFQFTGSGQLGVDHEDRCYYSPREK